MQTSLSRSVLVKEGKVKNAEMKQQDSNERRL